MDDLAPVGERHPGVGCDLRRHAARDADEVDREEDDEEGLMLESRSDCAEAVLPGPAKVSTTVSRRDTSRRRRSCLEELPHRLVRCKSTRPSWPTAERLGAARRRAESTLAGLARARSAVARPSLSGCPTHSFGGGGRSLRLRASRGSVQRRPRKRASTCVHQPGSTCDRPAQPRATCGARLQPHGSCDLRSELLPQASHRGLRLRLSRQLVAGGKGHSCRSLALPARERLGARPKGQCLRLPASRRACLPASCTPATDGRRHHLVSRERCGSRGRAAFGRLSRLAMFRAVSCVAPLPRNNVSRPTQRSARTRNCCRMALPPSCLDLRRSNRRGNRFKAADLAPLCVATLLQALQGGPRLPCRHDNPPPRVLGRHRLRRPWHLPPPPPSRRRRFPESLILHRVN